MGSEPTAAGGGRKEASEWQRSIKSRISACPMILSGTATGERSERCRGQIQRGERVAAVDKIEDQRKPEDFIGHRNRKPVLLSAKVGKLSLFINNKFWVFTVFFISANKDKFHIRHNSETAVAAKCTL